MSTPNVAPDKTVKAKGGKTTERKFYNHISQKGTQPFGDIIDKDGNFVAGLTEEQKVREGYYPPIQARPDFKKDDFDRKEWKRVHTNKKHTGASTPPLKKKEYKYTLLVHLKNPSNNNLFKTTYSFHVGRSEASIVLGGFAQRGEKVTKAYFKGLELELNG